VDEVAASVTLGHRLGLAVEEPVLLRSTNNTVVWLSPSPVVAKVFRAEAVAARELAIGLRLANRGAPIVSPAERVGSEVYEVDGWFLTLWRYVPQDEARPRSSKEIAVALHTLHEALASLADSTALPSYESQLRDAIGALEDPHFAPALAASDRVLLHEALGAALADLQPVSMVVIHGSPHGMNMLVDAGRPLFIDLETVQRGPVEWDLAHLAPEVAVHYPASYSDEILATSRIAVSATTPTLGWDAL